jgi:hypothetical protein
MLCVLMRVWERTEGQETLFSSREFLLLRCRNKLIVSRIGVNCNCSSLPPPFPSVLLTIYNHQLHIVNETVITGAVYSMFFCNSFPEVSFSVNLSNLFAEFPARFANINSNSLLTIFGATLET